jgi:hypothetical protein
LADLGTSTSTTPGTTTNGSGPGRSVRRHRSLPGGRAVAGAFLVTAAAVGVFAAYLDATAEPSASWLVATREVAAGDVIDADVLDEVAIDVPQAQRESLVPADRADDVVGRVALGPVREGDLLQWTTVLAVEPPEGASTFTFSVPSSRVAFRGDLAAGDTIDLVATYSETTVYVARDIPLLAGPATGGGDGTATITVAVNDPDTVLAVANALDAAQVYVLRSDPDGGETELPAPFRPDVGGR